MLTPKVNYRRQLRFLLIWQFEHCPVPSRDLDIWREISNSVSRNYWTLTLIYTFVLLENGTTNLTKRIYLNIKNLEDSFIKKPSKYSNQASLNAQRRNCTMATSLTTYTRRFLDQIVWNFPLKFNHYFWSFGVVVERSNFTGKIFT